MNPRLYHPTAPRLQGEIRARRAALDAKGLFMPRARDTRSHKSHMVRILRFDEGARTNAT
jgi:hypothetical protein